MLVCPVLLTKVAASSLLIMPFAVASAIDAFDAFESVTVKVSFSSWSASSVVATVNVFRSSPGVWDRKLPNSSNTATPAGAKVSVPESAV